MFAFKSVERKPLRDWWSFGPESHGAYILLAMRHARMKKDVFLLGGSEELRRAAMQQAHRLWDEFFSSLRLIVLFLVYRLGIGIGRGEPRRTRLLLYQLQDATYLGD